MYHDRDDQAAVTLRQIPEQEADAERIDPLDQIAVIDPEQDRLDQIGRPESRAALFSDSEI